MSSFFSCPRWARRRQVVIYTSSTNNTVEFPIPAYPGLYLSFPVLCPNYKQLAATTNRTGILTSSYGYLIIGLAQVKYQSAPQQSI